VDWHEEAAMGSWKKIAGVVLAAALSMPAQAADPDVPKRDPKGFYRYLTQEADSTTSTCIGNPVTPLCAVETVLACFVRSDSDLCRKANWPGSEEYDFSGGKISPFDDTRYFVQFAKMLSDKSARKYSIGGITPKPGDVVISVKKARRAPGDWSDPYPQPTVYLLRRYEGEWRAVTWDTESTRD
jgi:hypothetical protein